MGLASDAGPLLIEALRVLALKAAVFELTDGDEQAAELLVPGPVDEMVHAVLAQFTVMTRIQTDSASPSRMQRSTNRSRTAGAASPTPCTRRPAGVNNRCGTGSTRPRSTGG